MPKTKKEEEPKNEVVEKEISWRAAEFRYVEKGPGWYFAVAAAGLILIIIALVQKNFFFALFILIAGLIIFYLGRRRPKIENFQLTEDGIGFGKDYFYPYDKLESFAVNERPGQLNEIVFKKKTAFNPYLRLPVDDKLTPEAKELLARKLTEFKYDPSLIDILADWMGF